MRRSKDPRLVSQAVSRLLRGYAERGVFRSFSEGQRRGGTTTFQMVWHHGRLFRFALDTTGGLVSFPTLLPEVPPRSPMQRDLKAFLRSFETDEVPPHRRIDPAKARLRITRRAGGLSVALAVADARTGKLLWSFQTSQIWKASPMTYQFDRQQYVAVAAGSNILAFGLVD